MKQSRSVLYVDTSRRISKSSVGFGSLADPAPPAQTGGVCGLWQEAKRQSTTPPSFPINITHKPGKNARRFPAQTLYAYPLRRHGQRHHPFTAPAGLFPSGKAVASRLTVPMSSCTNRSFWTSWPR